MNTKSVALEQLEPKLQSDNLDEAMVNALKLDVDNRAYSTINWHISPPTALQGEEAKRLLLGFIIGVLNKSGKALGCKVGANTEDETTDAIATESGFKLKVCSSNKENTLHPKTLEGAGEITNAHGHKPLLMMIHLQKRFHDEWEDAGKPLVNICDEHGKSIIYKDFSSLEGVIELMGFNYSEVRSDATKLKLATEIFDWECTDSDIEDCFF
ncbi:hypothetical protein [Pseudoalteromonas sp. TAB23]|uniref:hypothetical protein n=1 Tax=Pseudoalteromonas sp. TAB23 TaxID=1938595 RepID=UPI0003F5C6BC|nr:hypothetical protein [Pseudoalteromonas sp. TAB23]